MYDLENTVYRKVNKLQTWRLRYTDRREYLYKVIVNLFYELYTTENLWTEIEHIFYASQKKYDDFDFQLFGP